MKRVLLLLCISLSAFSYATPVFKPWLGDSKLFKATPSCKYRSFRKIAEGDSTARLSATQYFMSFKMQVAPTSDWEILAGGALIQSSALGLKISEGMLATRYQLTSDILGDLFSSAFNLSVTIPNRALVKKPEHFYHGDADGELSLSLGREVTRGKYWLLRYWGFAGIGAANDSKPWGHFALGVAYNYRSYLNLFLLADAYHTFSRGELDLSDFKGYGRIRQKSCDIFLGLKWLQDYRGAFTCSVGKRVFARNATKDDFFGRLAYILPFSL